MSPSESDLRAALRDGEGDGPDAARMIAAGRVRAAQRRSRLLAGVGAVVAVLAVSGVAVGIAVDRGGDETASGSSAGHRNAVGTGVGGASTRPDRVAVSAPSRSTDASAVAGSTAQPVASATGAGCPTDTTGSHPVGRGSLSAAGGPLLPSTVRSVLVCRYDAATPTRTTLTAGQARELARSLNAADTEPPHICNDLRVAEPHPYAFVGVTDDGATDPVYVTLGNPTCSVVVSSRSAVRYNWAPPHDLEKIITG